jgi:hypothetical protein
MMLCSCTCRNSRGDKGENTDAPNYHIVRCLGAPQQETPFAGLLGSLLLLIPGDSRFHAAHRTHKGKRRFRSTTTKRDRWMAPHQLRIAPGLTARDICYWQILLQKSFRGGDRKFLKPLMRFTRGEVRDHIVSSEIGHAPP